VGGNDATATQVGKLDVLQLFVQASQPNHPGHGPAQRPARRALQLGLSPLPALRAQLRSRIWQLANERDAFAGTGLRDATGRSGRHLGHDVELRLLWNPSSWLQVDAGVAYWFKGSYFDTVPNAPNTDDTYYLYAAAHLRF
jgi:hypothetical protein